MPSKRVAKAKVGEDIFELDEDRRRLVINGVLCRIESDENGFVELEGPDEVWVKMRGYEEAHNRLAAVSEAIGTNVNALDLNGLDQVLAKSHNIIVQFVPDASSLDVSPEEYQALITEMNQFVHDFATDSDGIKTALKRSATIRKHMMAAKIEERIARGLAKKLIAGH